MKLATIRPNDIAAVKDGGLITLGATLARENALPPGSSMLDLIANYGKIKGLLKSLADKAPSTKLDSKMLKAPVERPSKIWAAATNYKRGSGGLNDARAEVQPARRPRNNSSKRFF